MITKDTYNDNSQQEYYVKPSLKSIIYRRKSHIVYLISHIKCHFKDNIIN